MQPTHRHLPGAALCTLAALLALACPAQATEPEPAQVTQIQITGNDRVSDAAIERAIQTTVGSPLDLDRLSRDLRAIYDLGLFEDVQIQLQQDGPKAALTFVVTERPILVAVHFKGLDALDQEDLMDAIDLPLFTPLSPAQITAAEQQITLLYTRKNRPLTLVKAHLSTPAGHPTERVVTFHIDEGDQPLIGAINFLGNSAVTDDELRDLMDSKPLAPLGSITGRGQYNIAVLENDLQKLNTHYQRLGHLDAKVGPVRTRLDRSGQRLFITIPIKEGPAYRLRSATITGTLLGQDPQKLRQLLPLNDGDIFDMERLRAGLQRLADVYRNMGHAHISAAPHFTRHPDHTVSLALDVTPGPKVRFGRITVTGNTWTRQSVVRRELPFAEGDWFNAAALRRAQLNVASLRLFEGVDIATSPSPTAPNTLDVQIKVVEGNRWIPDASLSLTPSGDVQLRLGESNLLGTGRKFRFGLVQSDLRQEFSILYIEPRLLDTRWNLHLELRNQELDWLDLNRASTGGRLSLGRFYELESWDAIVSLRPFIRLEDVDTALAGPSPDLLGDGLTTAAGLSLTLDNRDNLLLPGRGGALRITAESTLGPLSENQFLRFEANGQLHFTLPGDLRLRLRAGFGLIHALDNGQLVPERFFLGGPDSVRGFDRGTLAPTRRLRPTSGQPDAPLDTVQVGGNKALSLGIDLALPVPGTDKLRLVAFFDAGNTFDNGQDLALTPDLWANPDGGFDDALRTAVGLGIWWASPLGPLRVDFGFPLRTLSNEPTFTISISGGGL